MGVGRKAYLGNRLARTRCWRLGRTAAEMILPDGRENSRQASGKQPPIGENVSYPSILGSVGKSSRQRKFWHQNAAGSGLAAELVKAQPTPYFAYNSNLVIDIIIRNNVYR
jgi:hypothetical protein